MDLCFIDSGRGIDRRARKQIRSHVMKGKNTGRSVIGRGKKNAATAVSSPRSVHATDSERGAHRIRASPYESKRLSAETMSWRISCFGRLGNLLGMQAHTASSAGGSSATSIFPWFCRRPCAGSCSSVSPPSVCPLLQDDETIDEEQQVSGHMARALNPPEFCRQPGKQEPPQQWFQSMITNQGFLHCHLAMTSIFLAVLSNAKLPRTWTPDHETTQHLVRALRLVNEDLSSGHPPSDPTLAAIVSLTIQANYAGIGTSSTIHIAGLQRALALRDGADRGLAALRGRNVYLAQKIRRADIDVAMRSGARPRFALARDGPELHAMDSLLLRFAGDPTVLNPPLDAATATVSPRLKKLARVVRALCQVPGTAAGAAEDARLAPVAFQDLFLGLTNQLIAFAPLGGPRPASAVDDALQLGLLGFLCVASDQAGRIRVFYTGLLARLLRTRILDESFARTQAYRSLRLWLCFVLGLVEAGVYELDEGENGDWLCQVVGDVAAELGLNDWEAVKSYLAKFAWVGCLLDARGHELWDTAMGLTKEG